jgi:GTP-binding protein HflX
VIHNLPFLLSDTVGFIRKLPTQLIESFKSTLDEVREAELLLHVVDISHPNFEEHLETVDRTVAEIDGTEKPVIMIFNKIDAYQPEKVDPDDLSPRLNNRHFTLEQWQKTWFARTDRQAIFISATEKDNLEDLKNRLYETVAEIHARRYPNNRFLF